MTDYLLLYLFTRLDSLRIVIVVATIALAVLQVLSFFAISDGDGVGALKDNKTWGRSLIVSLFLVMGIVAIPSSKDLAIIVGGKIAADAVRSPEAAEIGGLVYDAIRQKLKEAAK